MRLRQMQRYQRMQQFSRALVTAMANTLSVMANVLRNYVSKQRKRYTKKGFNLDLTYICDNLIAMGYPADKMESYYRNRFEDVYKLLEEDHRDHYKIYNLCRERSYDINKFHGRVAVFPFEDHNPPTIQLILKFCEDIDAWLNADEQNVAAVHCKAGKGRTGTMICCYLLYCGQQTTAENALGYYDERRTNDRKGVTIPSQRRYVQYFSKLIQSGLTYEKRSLQLCEIRFTEANYLQSQGIVHCSVSVLQDTDSGVEVKPLQKLRIDFRKSFTLDMKNAALTVCGDIKIELTHKTSRKKIFHFWFNTYFVEDSADAVPDGEDLKMVYTLKKVEIDDAHKDKEHKCFSEDFKVQLVFYADQVGNRNRIAVNNRIISSNNHQHQQPQAQQHHHHQFSHHHHAQQQQLCGGGGVDCGIDGGVAARTGASAVSQTTNNYALPAMSSSGTDLNYICDQKSSSSASVSSSSLAMMAFSGGSSSFEGGDAAIGNATGAATSNHTNTSDCNDQRLSMESVEGCGGGGCGVGNGFVMVSPPKTATPGGGGGLYMPPYGGTFSSPPTTGNYVATSVAYSKIATSTPNQKKPPTALAAAAPSEGELPMAVDCSNTHNNYTANCNNVHQPTAASNHQSATQNHQQQLQQQYKPSAGVQKLRREGKSGANQAHSHNHNQNSTAQQQQLQHQMQYKPLQAQQHDQQQQHHHASAVGSSTKSSSNSSSSIHSSSAAISNSSSNASSSASCSTSNTTAIVPSAAAATSFTDNGRASGGYANHNNERLDKVEQGTDTPGAAATAAAVAAEEYDEPNYDEEEDGDEVDEDADEDWESGESTTATSVKHNASFLLSATTITEAIPTASLMRANAATALSLRCDSASGGGLVAPPTTTPAACSNSTTKSKAHRNTISKANSNSFFSRSCSSSSNLAYNCNLINSPNPPPPSATPAAHVARVAVLASVATPQPHYVAGATTSASSSSSRSGCSDRSCSILTAPLSVVACAGDGGAVADADAGGGGVVVCHTNSVAGASNGIADGRHYEGVASSVVIVGGDSCCYAGGDEVDVRNDDDADDDDDGVRIRSAICGGKSSSSSSNGSVVVVNHNVARPRPLPFRQSTGPGIVTAPWPLPPKPLPRINVNLSAATVDVLSSHRSASSGAQEHSFDPVTQLDSDARWSDKWSASHEVGEKHWRPPTPSARQKIKHLLNPKAAEFYKEAPIWRAMSLTATEPAPEAGGGPAKKTFFKRASAGKPCKSPPATCTETANATPMVSGGGGEQTTASGSTGDCGGCASSHALSGWPSSKQKLKIKLKKNKQKLSQKFQWFQNYFRNAPEEFHVTLAQQTVAHVRRNSTCSNVSRGPRKLSSNTPPSSLPRPAKGGAAKVPLPPTMATAAVVQLSSSLPDAPGLAALLKIQEHTATDVAAATSDSNVSQQQQRKLSTVSASASASAASISNASQSTGDLCDDYYSSICDNQLSFNNSPCKSPRSLADSLSFGGCETPARLRLLSDSSSMGGVGGGHSLRANGSLRRNMVVVAAKPAHTHAAIGFNVVDPTPALASSASSLLPSFSALPGPAIGPQHTATVQEEKVPQEADEDEVLSSFTASAIQLYTQPEEVEGSPDAPVSDFAIDNGVDRAPSPVASDFEVETGPRTVSSSIYFTPPSSLASAAAAAASSSADIGLCTAPGECTISPFVYPSTSEELLQFNKTQHTHVNRNRRTRTDNPTNVSVCNSGDSATPIAPPTVDRWASGSADGSASRFRPSAGTLNLLILKKPTAAVATLLPANGMHGNSNNEDEEEEARRVLGMMTTASASANSRHGSTSSSTGIVGGVGVNEDLDGDAEADADTAVGPRDSFATTTSACSNSSHGSSSGFGHSDCCTTSATTNSSGSSSTCNCNPFERLVAQSEQPSPLPLNLIKTALAAAASRLCANGGDEAAKPSTAACDLLEGGGEPVNCNVDGVQHT